jgi:hypothetical protein
MDRAQGIAWTACTQEEQEREGGVDMRAELQAPQSSNQHMYASAPPAL